MESIGEGNIIWWSREAERHFGFSHDDVKVENPPLLDSGVKESFSDMYDTYSHHEDPVLSETNIGKDITATIIMKGFF